MPRAIAVEYGLETEQGELINYFTWHELVEYFMSVPESTLKSAVYRGTTLLGHYKLFQVRYETQERT